MFHDDGATAYAARLLIDCAPGCRLDALVHLAGEEHLWRGAGPGADFAEAVRRYEAVIGRTLPRVASLPSFGAVEWRRAEVAVWLAGRFLGRLTSPSCGGADAGDWRADERLLAALGVARDAARSEPARGLLDAELRIIELARVHVVERGASV